MKASTSFICTSTTSCVDQHSYPQSEMRLSCRCFFLLLSGFWVTPCYANMALTGQWRSDCFCQTKNRWRVGRCCLLKMSEPVVRHAAHLNTSLSLMCILTSLFVQTDQSHKSKKYPLVVSMLRLPIVCEKVCDFLHFTCWMGFTTFMFVD